MFLCNVLTENFNPDILQHVKMFSIHVCNFFFLENPMSYKFEIGVKISSCQKDEQWVPKIGDGGGPSPYTSGWLLYLGEMFGIWQLIKLCPFLLEIAMQYFR